MTGYALLVIVASALYAAFLIRTQNTYWRVLAARIKTLQTQGIEDIWLLCNYHGLAITSRSRVQSFLTSGFLAYVSDGELHIEYPWQNGVETYQRLGTEKLQLQLCQIRIKPYDSWEWGNLQIEQPALLIDPCQYPFVVLGHNIEDAAGISQAVKAWKHMTNSQLRDSFYETVLQVNILTTKPKNQYWKP